MARNNLAHGQVWKTRNGDVVTLRAESYKESHPEFGDREWFKGGGMVYCNVEPLGTQVFRDMVHPLDLVERVE